jgi:hypothetical protein
MQTPTCGDELAVEVGAEDGWQGLLLLSLIVVDCIKHQASSI